MEKSAVAAMLSEIAVILDILGENPFKVKAHQSAARAIETLPGDLDEIMAGDHLTDIKGIGSHIAEKIKTFAAAGALPELEALRKKVPAGLFDILKIPGLGPKKAKALWDKLGVTTIRELEYACNENRLVELSGFGAKSQENIIKGIKNVTKFAGRRLAPEAFAAAGPVIEWVLKGPAVKRAQLAGSVRRGLETVKDIDIVASSQNPEKVMDRFVKAPGVAEIIGQGPTKSSIRLESGFQVDLRVVDDAQYPFALHHFTGSREHNTLMRSRAKAMGLKMNEYGVFRGEKLIACGDEEEIFAALKLAYIPPELREGIDEIDESEKGRIPKLVEPGDITGIFHAHTVASDGVDTLENMAAACKKMGSKYLGISEHSRTAAYAGGLSIDELEKQGDEIDEVNAKLSGFRVFKGVESDILNDGSLDYPDKVLAKLDFVIASVHSGFNMDEKKMTERIVRAIENPFTTMLGHPTGRLLLARDGYPVNMGKVIEACAKHDVIIELNANPHRLDIDWRVMKLAKDAGVKISVNPDAHRVSGLADVAWGVAAARKGWLEKGDVFNTMAPDKIEKELERRKK
ncbi:MAG: DNA polymerase/3'-5' exonuclease PolX [Nitrospinae bacterium]|nr:DNA polymerase/3'-5' exonuclease PolX [Nitrospinota bacterium]